jgi:Holliday junction resolvase RusA-like endonuclease
MKVVWPVEPIPKERHRHLKRPKRLKNGRVIKTYNPQKAVEKALRLLATTQINEPPVKGAVKIECLFVFSRPKSHYGTGRNSGKLKPSAPKYHIVKPDSDNLLKMVKDVLNTVAYKDDCQVCRDFVSKEYVTGPDDQPRIEVTLTQLS